MYLSYLKLPVLLLVIATFCAPALAGPSGSGVNTTGGAVHQAASVPAALRPALYQAIAGDTGQADAIGKYGCATLSKVQLAACFTKTGVHFTLPASQRESTTSPLALHLVAWGRSPVAAGSGDGLTSVAVVKPTIKGNEASYAHGNLTEWWRVLPMGFEQGFTIAKRPAGHGELTLALAASSSDGGTPSIRHSRAGGNPVEKGILIVGRDTTSNWISAFAGMTKKDADTLSWGKLRYGQLVVTDATGKVIPATLTSKGNRILIAVNDARASYPLTVDPLVWLEQKVTANDGRADDSFGVSVAVAGATAMVGSLTFANGNDGPGAVYVFTESDGTWSQTAKLTASDGVENDGFGASIALAGTTAFIGASCAPFNPQALECGPGAVYVFTESDGTWSQTAELTASDGAADDYFGASVALSGTTALVGAPCAPSTDEDCGPGALYVFSKSNGTWTQVAKLAASDGAAGDSFGASVALDGTSALIGAPDADGELGAVYVFGDSGGSWMETQKLVASNRTTFDEFGVSVVADGGTAIVGAPGITVNFNYAQGAAYVFTELGGSWSQTQMFTASGGTAGAGFGGSVAISGDTALIGATYAAVQGLGAAYVFDASNDLWSESTKIVASDGAANNGFGGAVALAGSTALVGADYATIQGHPNQGAVYIYGGSDLDLALNAPDWVIPGSEFVSQAIATNNASAASPAVALTVAVPSAASFVSASASQGSCSEDANVVTCNFGAIDGNAGTATANLTLKATGNAGTTIENVAGVAKATPSLSTRAPTVIDNPPVAENGTLTTEENTAANGVLEASDPDGDPLTFAMVDPPSHGTVTITSAGAYLYTPKENYSGADSFTFKASDGQADSNVATISITVKAASPPPSGGGGGGGATAPLGLGLLALVGLLAFLRRRR